MLKQRWTKVLVFLASLAPVFWACWRAWNQDLTANPIEYITRYTGDWTIRFIVFTLAVNMLLLRFWACEGLERQTSRSAFLVNFAVIGGLLLATSV